MNKNSIRIRCLMRDQIAHILPIIPYLEAEANFIFDEEWNPESIKNSTTDIVILVNDFSYEIAQCIEAARSEGIPTLTLQDGVLEWRCQYENPIFAAGGGPPQHQPVLSDKIACLGAQSARHIAMWGNASKVEITGMPRLDRLLNLPIPKRDRGKKRRLLVLTAKKPWFDEYQKKVTLKALCDVRDYVVSNPEIEIIWRTTKNVELELGVTNTLTALDSSELVNILDSVDAVISTPSTAIIETMLRGRPVAVLDYHNTPQFLPTAWTISCPEQISATIAEMLAEPPNKMLFQKACLHDALRTEGSASARVADLIRRMVTVAQDCRKRTVPLELPPNLLGTGEIVFGTTETPLSVLYPSESIYREFDITALQGRLIRAQKELVKLQSTLSERSLSYWVAAFGKYIRQYLRK